MFRIINKDLENYSYQIMKYLKEISRKIVLMEKAHSIINLDKSNMEHGAKIFWKKDYENLDHFIIDLI